MYLKELRINGFKSFAQAVRLSLEPGMTAIVGPNGCGKSNIADALRWVLGEQSTRSLRAGTMQDVLFQGSATRKPLNLCEVSLVFTECEAQLGVDFHEVEVTRRVLREGASQYFLNGKSCRLRDIQRLFLNTGIGQVSYSFMLQGQIDQILSANPAERRILFEEAAGISKYKAQRREALSKLTQVEANLARVTDVIEEVSRQLGSLKRQAVKAWKHEFMSRRLRHCELAAAGRRYRRLMAEVSVLEQDAEAQQNRLNALRERLGGKEEALAVHKARRAEEAGCLEAAQQETFELRRQRDETASRIEMARVRAHDDSNRILALRSEIAGLRAKAVELEQEATGQAERKARQTELFGDSETNFSELEGALADVGQRLSDAERKLSRHKTELAQAETGLSRVRANCLKEELEVKGADARLIANKEEAKRLQQEEADLLHQAAEFATVLGARQRTREQVEGELKTWRAALEELEESARKQQELIRTLDRDIATNIARTGTLENLQRKFEGFSAGAKAILQGKLSAHLSGCAPRVFLELLLVEAAYVDVLETLLDASGDAVFIEQPDAVTGAIAGLEKGQLGRACLIHGQDGEGAADASGEPELPSAAVPDGVVAVNSVVRAREPLHAGLVQRVFAGCWFAPDLAKALAFARSTTQPFRAIATFSGELVDTRGFVFGGHGGARKDSSFLQRAAEIRRLNKHRSQLEAELEEVRQSAEQIRKSIDQQRTRVEEGRRRLIETGQELSALHAQIQGSEKAQAANKAARERCAATSERLRTDRAAGEERLARANQALGELERHLDTLREGLREGEEQIASLRQEREQRREAFDKVRLERIEKRQRLADIERDIRETSRRAREAAHLADQREREIEGLAQRVEQFTREQEAERARIGAIESRISQSAVKLEEVRQSLRKTEEAIAHSEEALQFERRQTEELAETLNRQTVALARLQTEGEHLASGIQQRYAITVASLNWRRELYFASRQAPVALDLSGGDQDNASGGEEGELGLPEIPEPTEADLLAVEEPDWQVLQKEIKVLTQRLESLGSVNPLAIEEYRSLQARHVFLQTQSNDLWSSRDQLVAAIDSLNKTSLELFQDTFEKVRKNFHYTFDQLFGGGEADLALVEAEDILESGIEITARPPGTRLRSLALLSGGQKTMTAVALLFAVYMVKPSPFCVLDELDAPLDDANIGRFCAMLERFLEFSQFVVITHNKRTIAAADTIYGVTMAERGVSRILSMRFNRNSGKVEENQAYANPL